MSTQPGRDGKNGSLGGTRSLPSSGARKGGRGSACSSSATAQGLRKEGVIMQLHGGVSLRGERREGLGLGGAAWIKHFQSPRAQEGVGSL